MTQYKTTQDFAAKAFGTMIGDKFEGKPEELLNYMKLRGIRDLGNHQAGADGNSLVVNIPEIISA